MRAFRIVVRYSKGPLTLTLTLTLTLLTLTLILTLTFGIVGQYRF